MLARIEGAAPSQDSLRVLNDALTSAPGVLRLHFKADSCDRIFLRTHARRQWCSTRCGHRMRAARAYARKRAALSS